MRATSILAVAGLVLAAGGGSKDTTAPRVRLPVARLASISLRPDTVLIFIGDSVKVTVSGRVSDGTVAGNLGLTATAGYGVRGWNEHCTRLV